MKDGLNTSDVRDSLVFTHTNTQTPEKLLSDVIQTFTPTEVERSSVVSRLHSTNVEQQVQKDVVHACRGLTVRNRNSLCAKSVEKAWTEHMHAFGSFQRQF